MLPQIKAVRTATRMEKKKKAMALRDKELGALGMRVSMHCKCGYCLLDNFVAIVITYHSPSFFASPSHPFLFPSSPTFSFSSSFPFSNSLSSPLSLTLSPHPQPSPFLSSHYLPLSPSSPPPPQVNEKGQVVAKSPLLKELASLEEEAGIKCCICLEGYKNHPQKVN